MVAACWSPATPRIGIAAPNSDRLGDAEIVGAVLDLRQHRRGDAQDLQQLVVPVIGLDVVEQRAGGIGGVGACTLPPVSRQIRKLSIVPEAVRRARRACGRLSRCRAARRSWCRRNRGRAAARSSAENFFSRPCFLQLFAERRVRRSCQTMALWIGLPVALSQTTTVSRWLVMPMAAMSAALSLAAFSASRQVADHAVAQISSGSCSTQPDAG